jgi:hypothetical protein
MPLDVNESATPRTPIITDPDIENGYVRLDRSDVLYNDYNTTTLLTITSATANATGTPLATSVCSLTASLTGSNSAVYHTVRMALYNEGMENTFTGLTSDIGIISFRKRKIDTKLKIGTLTASVSSGSFSGDFVDTGSGQFKRLLNSAIVGNVINDLGLVVLTAGTSGIVLDITAVKYNAVIQNTSLNVFCKCYPYQLNFSLNPTSLQTNSNWMDEPFTASTSSSTFSTQLTKSGIAWQPLITHVGVYDDNNNLLAVAKLATALRKPTDLPLTFRLNLDL